jgi:hypothetical protein
MTERRGRQRHDRWAAAMCIVAALAASGGLDISESPPPTQITEGGVFTRHLPPPFDDCTQS